LRKPCGTIVDALTRTHAFSSAEVNTNTAPGFACPLWIASSLRLTASAWGSTAASADATINTGMKFRTLKFNDIDTAALLK
jgi:hypothetical protein